MLDINTLENTKKFFIEEDLVNIKISFLNLFQSLRETNFLYDKTYFHPLGFIYSELFEFPNRDTLRLNIWNEQRYYQEPLMDIHNHFYNLNSFVVIGKMVNNLYQIQNDDKPNYSVYAGSYKPTIGRTLKKTDLKLNAKLSEVQTINEGEFYQITKDKLHSSYVSLDQFTCTFVYASERGNPSPLVLGPLDGSKEYQYANKLVEKSTIDKILSDITRH